MHDPGHGEAVAHGGIDRALIGDEERAHERRIRAKQRVDARADRRASDQERIARAIRRDVRMGDLEPARGHEHRPFDRDARARRRSAALHRHGGRHRAAEPAHLRVHVGSGRGGVLELRSPLRAMRRVRAAACLVRRAPERDARAGSEEGAERGVCADALERKERRVRDAEDDRERGRGEKAGDEPRSIDENGERDERHRSRSLGYVACAASSRRGEQRASALLPALYAFECRGFAATRWMASITTTASCARV